MKLLIFDLDDTLVESSALRSYREEKEWDEVQSGLGDVELFVGVAEMLHQAAARGCKLAVVTSSPKWYAQALIKQHGLPIDVVIGYDAENYSKPSPDPINAAMKAAKITNPSNVLAIGDRCVDTASAHAAGVRAIGALWGAANPRDLRQSFPEYIATSAEEATEIIDAWITTPDATTGPAKSRAWLDDMTIDYFWQEDLASRQRQHLRGAYDYTYARYRYRGTWNTSWMNSLVHSFKSGAPNARYFKKQAAHRFCVELAPIIPKKAYVTYVLPSTKKGEEGYDDRWELLAECLQGKGVRSVWPIGILESRTPAHESEPTSELRDPTTIMENLEWVQDLPKDCTTLYIVDDVLTKGGHLRAYADFVSEKYPDITIKCVAWALHTSENWYDANTDDDWDP